MRYGKHPALLIWPEDRFRGRLAAWLGHESVGTTNLLVVDSFERARAHLVETRVSCVVSAEHLGDGAVDDLLAWLRGSELAHPPVVVLADEPTEARVLALLESGADECLGRSDASEAVLRRLLDRVRARTQAARARATLARQTGDDTATQAVEAATDLDTLRTTEGALTLALSSLEQAGDPIFWLTEAGRFSYANEAAASAFGCSSDELADMGVLELDPGLTEDGWRDTWSRLQQQRVLSYQTTMLRRDGERFRAEVQLTRLSQDGETFALAFVRDVEERLALEEQLRQAQKMEAVGRMAGAVAHDFNNLLTAIACSADVAAMDLATSHPASGCIDEIIRISERASTLTNQLVAFSRNSPADPRVVNLPEVIADLHRMLRRLVGTGIEVTTVLDDDVVPALIDPGLLEQIVVNLVINAEQAMGGSGTLTIRTAAEIVTDARAAPGCADVVAPGHYSCIEVSDTGCGIEPGVLSRIFEPFFTTKQRGQGSGLGLATCYGIVCQAGGSILVDTSPGVGTTFWVYLPRAEGPVERGRRRTTQPIEQFTGSERVLVVDDERTIRTMVARILRELGYAVQEAANGAEALEQVQLTSTPFALLLTDVVMPLVGGVELATRLKATAPELRVLYMSGYADGAFAAGPGKAAVPSDSILPKPFTPWHLAMKVRNTLDARA